jgi:uncharacterized damage-inducible protein DinB
VKFTIGGILRHISDAEVWANSQNPRGVEIANGKWLCSMVEQEIHHRGQIYRSLGLLDVSTPAPYGQTSEDVRARSESRMEFGRSTKSRV